MSRDSFEIGAAMNAVPADQTTPAGQKFHIGQRVRLTRERGHWPAGTIATIEHSYCQKFAKFGFARNVRDYSLMMPHGWSEAWYDESVLEAVEE